MKIVTVLKCGGEFNEGHVQRIKKQLPDIEMDCITDSTMSDEAFKAVTGANKIRLLHDAWGGRGWWAKMEMFRPDISGDFLYVDLDTVFLKSPAHMFSLSSPCVLSDFYFPDKSIGSGLMFLTEACRNYIWNLWIKAPAFHIGINHGDQDFLNQYLWSADRFQDKFPNEVISYKAHINAELGGSFFKGKADLNEATVVCFHGQPRPWEISVEWMQK